eukprot:200676-Chlamydomonas_euryale.AAC.16
MGHSSACVRAPASFAVFDVGRTRPFLHAQLEVLKQLRDQRKSIQDKISEIKAMVSGDIRSEAELDARIAEQEEKIRFGTVPLREEKMVINEMRWDERKRTCMCESVGKGSKSSRGRAHALPDTHASIEVDAWLARTTCADSAPRICADRAPRCCADCAPCCCRTRSKLRQMRDKIKEFEARKAELPDLESEKTKVKAILAEKDSEFSIMKGERDSVSKVVQEKYTELKNAESEAHKVQEEQEAAVERKNEALEALEAARREMDATMADYRENRKFSLQVWATREVKRGWENGWVVGKGAFVDGRVGGRGSGHVGGRRGGRRGGRWGGCVGRWASGRVGGGGRVGGRGGGWARRRVGGGVRVRACMRAHARVGGVGVHPGPAAVGMHIDSHLQSIARALLACLA